MPTYIWSGIDNNGKKSAGIDWAANSQQLKNTLYQKGILPLKVRLKISLTFWYVSQIRSKNTIDFIEQLAILINANIPLVSALTIIMEDEKNVGLRNLITNLKKSISAGQSLYQTLCQYPQHFNELLCGLINVGEQSGNLDIILNELTNHFTRLTIQRRKIIKALLYPATVLSITLIVTTILLLFVIPQFKTIYSSLGANLPNYTQSIINIGDILQQHGVFILISLASIAFCLKLLHHRSLKFQQYLQDLSLKTPILNKLLTYAIIARLTKTIALAFKSGMPLLQAIKVSASVSHHWRYQLAMHKIAEAIANGKTLHSSITEQKLFPGKVSHLIALGEETGKLDTMLEKIAAIYGEELNHLIDNMNSLLEPFTMIILGIIIGSVIVGMYLPIFRLGMAI